MPIGVYSIFKGVRTVEPPPGGVTNSKLRVLVTSPQLRKGFVGAFALAAITGQVHWKLEIQSGEIHQHRASSISRKAHGSRTRESDGAARSYRCS